MSAPSVDVANTKELPREMSAADVAEETKADVEAVAAADGDSLSLALGFARSRIVKMWRKRPRTSAANKTRRRALI